MLCGCVSHRSAGPEAEAPPAAADLKALTTCERLLTEVPLPKVTAGVDDANVAFVKDDAALIAANRRIAAGRACVTDVRKRYAPK